MKALPVGIVAGTGRELSACVPFPNWPESFNPQDQIVPLLLSATPYEAPAAICWGSTAAMLLCGAASNSMKVANKNTTEMFSLVMVSFPVVGGN